MSTRHGSATVVLPSDTTILITRSFDAPAALIFRALTEPELVTRWWGFEDAQWEVCEIDLRVGGTWRYVVRQPCESEPDREVAFHGEYRELDPPHRLVSTEVFEGVPEGEAVVSTTLDEVDEVTTMRVLVQHTCKEHRDGHVESGMEVGMQVSYNRIEDLLRDLG
ncbi:SRPBCC family protein [Mycobacteroides abscessus]|uniref:SRPBCC family protein n=1 Tax=Mycobacteroides abscessus TaxID=36809 RepID=UPI00092CA773|nr:SRPBCC family protein [Mycobacteroides abscessus]SHQ65758.1 activator of Hsp90 ATPase 1 family protein [Mycobacteroides abscessus subsp. abscessus]SHS10575.1 activator of Hsp90 ATPase 1 family protein [Mycobacteroides abscessus subsp. abscessus]SHS23143.1 activator of Hsp90 ATPase 1 family protein [Mycobacteroides abscessus subsp. abscessus]SIE27392.1 activator of Hsp90 ATPase 1 family protein [Mycobacteroides abscessus subsp. abscessus]SKD57623.1 activator of Hsp90 ATPase 1 family protein 